jgi:p-aminobenzoyl-glutamate transporter AbgT
LNLFARFSKNTQIPNFIKIIPVGAELFHADGRTDVTKLKFAFCNFANASTDTLLTRIFILVSKGRS